jgi:nucleoside-diphosphate-sugar epimerase
VRIFVAGASGVIGARLVPLLVRAGHQVAGMTRSPDKAEALRTLGAVPVVCDVYDAARLTDAVVAFRPELVMHQLTDLPDDAARIGDYMAANARIRSEGTLNLIAAARAASADRLLAQSIAWTPPGDTGSTRAHEEMVLEAGGVVLRYGRLYGPGTYHVDVLPEHPRVHVDAAAARTLDVLDAPTGIITIADDVEPAPT